MTKMYKQVSWYNFYHLDNDYEKNIIRSRYPGKHHMLRKKHTIHQLTTMLSASKNDLFPGRNLLTTGADDPSLAGAQMIIKVSVSSTDGYDLEIQHF